MARLHLGAHERVLGAPASEIAGRIVALEELWGSAATRRLLERLAATRTSVDAAAILERAIAERLGAGDGARPPSALVLGAADRLTSGNVTAVADELGVSERHLRRVFRHAVGVSPKTFAKLKRFRRAVQAAYESPRVSWASIAAGAGYYDQAHLIADFRAITGVTPQTLLGELRPAPNGAR
jgi:AraC-like DNA-binding protein